MRHAVEPTGAVVVGCKVLPIFNDTGVDAAVKKMVHRIDGKKAVARVKELLKRAAQAKPHTTVNAKKWKKVLSFQGRDHSSRNKDEQQEAASEGMSSSDSSKLSFKWDVGSCSSTSSVYSSMSFASAPGKTEHALSRLSSSSSMISPHRLTGFEPSSLLCKSSSRRSPKNEQTMDDEQQQEQVRMGQWITTDSDFVVLEL